MFVAFVPHAHIEYASGDESAIDDADEETGGEESREILGDACENTNDTPDESESGQPKPWGREFEHDIARDLKQHIADKVDGQCCQELASSLCWVMVRDVQGL